MTGAYGLLHDVHSELYDRSQSPCEHGNREYACASELKVEKCV
ncbi:Uncharacterised protein [Vibrio cholerae]|nr:Uncharacterised protein [Vibrio cholerae]